MTIKKKDYKKKKYLNIPEVPPLYRETQSLGQHMLNAPVGINGLRISIL